MLSRIVGICMLTLPAFAGQITYTTVASSSTQTTLPRFDPTLGPLTLVRFDATASVHGTFQAENVNGSFPLHSQVTLVTQCTASVPYPLGSWSVAGNIPSSVMLAPFDGTVDFRGISGATVTVPQTLLGSSSHDIPMDAAGIDYFTGHVALPITVDPPVVTLSWPGVVPFWTVDLSSDMTLSVTYFFGTYPIRFCTSQTTMPCPCGSSMGDTGCPSSAGSGADLVPSGTSSVSTPTFTLTASGLPATTTSLLFGGTSTLQVGQAFGDGIRCVTGTTSRLGIQTALSGVAAFAVPAGSAGDLRAYQVWYRNSASFCTPATFNLTSGVVTVWIP